LLAKVYELTMSLKRKGSKKKSSGSWKNLLLRCDCRCLPHGFYALIPSAIATMAFWTTMVQDGCDFVRLEGGNVEKITESDVFPYIEAGLSHFRSPIFDTIDGEWKIVFTPTCLEYEKGTMDTMWILAQRFSLVSSIFGGSLTFFLWFTTCMTFSSRTWKFCAFEAFMAALFRAGSFLYFLSSICTSNETQCNLFFGSYMDILGLALYVAATILLLAHYPDPKLRLLSDEEIIQAVAEVENLKPKMLSVPSTAANDRDFV
jgi:hypothetical protein